MGHLCGYLFCFAAMCMLLSVSVEAAIIAYEFVPNTETPSREPVLYYTFGRDLWLGWCAGGISFVVGICMICGYTEIHVDDEETKKSEVFLEKNQRNPSISYSHLVNDFI